MGLDNCTAIFSFTFHDLAVTFVSPGGAILLDVAITADLSNSTKDLTTTLSSAGTVSLEIDNSASVSLLADLIYTKVSTNKAIMPKDALDAVRLSVGLTILGGSKTALWFSMSDLNQNVKLTPQDALGILKYSVCSRELDTDWIFVDNAGDYSGITKGNVSFAEGFSIINVSSNARLGLMGTLLGDVNDTDTSYLDSNGTVV